MGRRGRRRAREQQDGQQQLPDQQAPEGSYVPGEKWDIVTQPSDVADWGRWRPVYLPAEEFDRLKAEEEAQEDGGGAER